MLNTSLVEFFDEILGGLLQSKHFDALIADQLDDGLPGSACPLYTLKVMTRA